MKRARTVKRTATVATTAPAATAAGGKEIVTVPVAPPRNPYATLARKRSSGAHGGDSRSRRHKEKKELHDRLKEE